MPASCVLRLPYRTPNQAFFPLSHCLRPINLLSAKASCTFRTSLPTSRRGEAQHRLAPRFSVLYMGRELRGRPMAAPPANQLGAILLCWSVSDDSPHRL